MILVVSTGGAGAAAAAAGVGIKIAAMSTGSGIAAELSGDGLVEVDVVVVVVEDEMTAVDVVVVDFAAEAGLTDMLISCLFGNSSISLWFTVNVLNILLILTSSAISVVYVSCAICCCFLRSYLCFCKACILFSVFFISVLWLSYDFFEALVLTKK